LSLSATPPKPMIFSAAGAEFAGEAREGTADSVVVHLHLEVFDLGLFGQAERVRRIRPSDERVRVGPFGALDHRRIVLGAERVGFVVDDFESGLREVRLAKFEISMPYSSATLTMATLLPIWPASRNFLRTSIVDLQ